MKRELVDLANARVEVLMSAMHQTDFEIAKRTGIKSDLLIINQCDIDDYQELVSEDGHLWRMISTKERGLGKSRQRAIENARGDICLFCDDDEQLTEGYAELLLRAYAQCEGAHAVVFNLNRLNSKNKKKYYKITKCRKAPSYRGYGSPMLSFLREPVVTLGIRVSDKFGSGTEWGGGEDILFERDMRRAGLKIYEFAEVIATIDYSGGSSWFNGADERYFYNQGAFITYAYSPFLRCAHRVYMAFRLRKDKRLSFFAKLKWMKLGGRGLRKNVTYKEFVAGRQSGN